MSYLLKQVLTIADINDVNKDLQPIIVNLDIYIDAHAFSMIFRYDNGVMGGKALPRL